ncbi:MAG: hypothetical protein HY313_07965 [Acidobacteria bacterium]|nr:hypothetical protein [Acidobacteriota bacterium]
MATWEKYGLTAPAWYRPRAREPRFAQLSREGRFRLALEQEGGLFPTFGQFLAGRVDLLPNSYLDELQKLQPLQRVSTPPLLERELASQISGLQGIRNAPGRDVFSAVYQGQSIVLEVYQENLALDRKSWDDFCVTIRRLGNGPEAAIARKPVLEQFWNWLQVQSDIERKRTILGNLQKIPKGSVSRFPSLISELQSPRCLVYQKMEGSLLGTETLLEATAGGTRLRILVEAILEQSLLFCLIDTDAMPENYVLLPDGGIGFRSLPAWVSVPSEWHYELLQYLASSVADHTPRALQMLCRMCSNGDPHWGELHLLNRLSSLQPELKINVMTPESVTALENYWRALARTALRPPPFLQLFHRNLVLLGHYNGLAAPSTDLVAEGLWPVLGRVIRFHLGEILSTEKSKEWIVSSALLLMTATRQLSLALEQVRETRSELSAAPDSRESDSQNVKLNRRTASLIRSAVALVAFLFSVQLAYSAGGAVIAFLTKSAAVIAGVVLFILVARIK